MNISPFALLVIIFGLLAFAVTDWINADETEVLPQGDCPSDRVQVVHMDNSRQMTVVLDRGVDCVTILEGIR